MNDDQNETPKAIFGAIADAMEAVGHVPKTGQGQYSAQTIESITNSLHKILKDHRIFCVPVCLEHHVEQVDGKEGKRPMHAVVRMQYRFYTDDGSFVEVVTAGEGLDHSERAIPKAQTCAMKYAFRQLFCLPTAEDDADVEPLGSGNSPAETTNQALADKPKTNGKPELTEGQQEFIAQVKALAERDLGGMGLNTADYQQIAGDVVVLAPNAKGSAAMAEWLRDCGRLTPILDDDDKPIGVTVETLEGKPDHPQAQPPGSQRDGKEIPPSSAPAQTSALTYPDPGPVGEDIPF